MEGAPVAVVGVAGDTKFSSLRAPVRPTAYVPFRQQAQRSMTFALRSELPPSALLEPLQRVVREVDPNVPLFGVRTQRERVSEAMRPERLFALLVSGFAVLALLLAAVGIYGTLAYQVSRRTAEIGLRLALGAGPLDIARLVGREAVVPVGLGVLAGLAATFAFGRFAESLLYGTSSRDPVALVAACLTLLASALLAGALPARRAARIAPMQALRQD